MKIRYGNTISVKKRINTYKNHSCYHYSLCKVENTITFIKIMFGVTELGFTIKIFTAGTV